ncbi:MAG: tRNA dimethylallyltransferase [Actinomycetota bacterium]|nr:tRNA dimethylallyltransferase [Actinomycetota bacterium]
MTPRVIAIFGPTGIGKTGVAIELARLLDARGEPAVAVNCDSIQVYSGLPIISGAPSREELDALEHRLLGFVPLTEEYSAGRYAAAAHEEIDGLISAGRRVIVVGGTGLYLRAALAELDLRPPVSPELRQEVESEVERLGPEALHEKLPQRFREWVQPGDRKRIARITELVRAGHEPAADQLRGGELWTRELRHPALLAGLTEEDGPLTDRISLRVEAMAAAGAAQEAESATRAGASRTVRAAIGFEQFPAGDLERIKILHRRYGRRQMTWMRRMDGVEVFPREGQDNGAVARRILRQADRDGNILDSGTK